MTIIIYILNNFCDGNSDELHMCDCIIITYIMREPFKLEDLAGSRQLFYCGHDFVVPHFPEAVMHGNGDE